MAFYIGFYAYAIIVHNWADQLLPQLFMEQFDTLRYNVDTLNICMKEFGLLTLFTLSVRASVCSKWLFNKGFFTMAIIVQSQADQLLPQLFLEQFDNFALQCRHIEHMHEEVWFVIPPANFVKKPQLKNFQC